MIRALLLSLLATQPNVVDFALKQWHKDPEVRIEDAYKWLYQATRGSEHEVADEQMVRDYLEQEWRTLGKPGRNEPLWEPLRRDGRLGRLNLRPFRARGGRAEDIVAAFIAGAKEFKNDEMNFRLAWNDLGTRLARAPLGQLTRPEWERLDKEMSSKNYLAIHHSASFAKAREPAYRVLTHSAFAKLLKTLRQHPQRPKIKAALVYRTWSEYFMHHD